MKLKMVFYVIGGLFVLWLGNDALDKINAAISGPCRPGEAATPMAFMRLFVLAGTVAFPSLLYLIHNGPAGKP